MLIQNDLAKLSLDSVGVITNAWLVVKLQYQPQPFFGSEFGDGTFDFAVGSKVRRPVALDEIPFLATHLFAHGGGLLGDFFFLAAVIFTALLELLQFL